MEEKENFTTELLALLLSSNKLLCSQIVYRLFNEKAPEALSQNFTIETQQYFEGGNIVDMLIRNDRYFIIFENKTGSQLGESQLERYYEILQMEKKFTKRKVLLVYIDIDMPDVVPIEQNNACESSEFKKMEWKDVWNMLKEIEKSHGSSLDYATKVLLKEFFGWMEVNDMGGFEGFKADDLGAWPRYIRLKHKLESIIKSLKKNQELGELLKKYNYEYLNPSKSDYHFGQYAVKRDAKEVWVLFGFEGNDEEVGLKLGLWIKVPDNKKSEARLLGYEEDEEDDLVFGLKKALIDVAPPSLSPSEQERRIIEWYMKNFAEAMKKEIART
jgi:hypothetical protein